MTGRIKRIHVLAYAAWLIVGPPFCLTALIGAASTLFIFPLMLLVFGLAFTGDRLGWGWCVYATLVVLLWSLYYLLAATAFVKSLRVRFFDIELFVMLVLLSLGMALTVWAMPGLVVEQGLAGAPE